MKTIKLTQIGEWTLLGQSKIVEGRTYYFCRCSCGKEGWRRERHLFNGKTMSCGHDNKNNLKHGKEGSPEYDVWLHIKGRCYRITDDRYDDYGGRGIKVCDRWLESFENFYTDMGDRPIDKQSLDRIDVNGNYCKENCRWATNKEQQNNKRNNFNIEYLGRIKTLSEWADEYKIGRGTLRDRLIRQNLPIEIALTRNVRGH